MRSRACVGHVKDKVEKAAKKAESNAGRMIGKAKNASHRK
jgi:hypothetical protein